jgi:glycosyltransferase involved in cell wall biosynthesis
MVSNPTKLTCQVAVVAIGRNEGQRLQACLRSAIASANVALVVYVDSGSTDGSVAFAHGLGCAVVSLDLSTPFTAARARNQGLATALQTLPKLEFVQFVDGDCEFVPGWIENARSFMLVHPEVAAVCGRRRERHPQNSIYNQLCDLEWDTPVGQAKSCGGDVMMRVNAIQHVGGYRASLIAGEEPELCVRLRAQGWQIWRLDNDMTLHDAAILRIAQWWGRSRRAGYAFAAGASLHGGPPERHWVKESRRIWFWGLGLPVGVLTLAPAISPWLLLLLAAYPLHMLRVYWRSRSSMAVAGWYAIFVVLGKFPEMLGQLKFLADRVMGTRSGLIEYK